MPVQQSLLVVCDNFLIGGRETYISTCLAALNKSKKGSFAASLLAGNIDLESAKNTFHSSESVANIADLSNWLASGSHLIEQQSISQIWVHHYALLPALLLAVKYHLPLIITLHGAPLSAGKLESAHDVLALSLAAQGGAKLTAVSQEIRDQLSQLGFSKDPIACTPNCVPITPLETKVAPKLDESNIKQCVLLTRPQKLGHIRAAVKLVSQLNKQGMPARLTIYTGRQFGQSDGERSITSVLGRKWLLLNPLAYQYLSHVEIKPPIPDAQQVINESDIVFGMGRVILEGIAANKPCVLIGYDRAIGLVDDASFANYQYSNFSGRGLEHSSPKQIAKKLRTMPEQLSEKNRQRVSIDSAINDWVAIFNEACVPAIEAKQYIADYESGRFSEQELKLTLHSLLSSQNLGVYSQLGELSI